MMAHKRKLSDNLVRFLDRGRFIKYTSLGGYPVAYYDKGGDVLCADCARKALKGYEAEWPAFADVYYEGPVEYCTDCNAEIESAYGDPDSDTVDHFDE